MKRVSRKVLSGAFEAQVRAFSRDGEKRLKRLLLIFERFRGAIVEQYAMAPT